MENKMPFLGNIKCRNLWKIDYHLHKKTIDGKTYEFDSKGVLKTGSGSGTNVTAAYIGNKNTKKFHKSSCSSVGKMNESNKVGFDSRSAAISAGYDPCKNCNP